MGSTFPHFEFNVNLNYDVYLGFHQSTDVLEAPVPTRVWYQRLADYTLHEGGESGVEAHLFLRTLV